MATYNLYDAKNSLSELVERAVNGEEVVIARRNVPAVKLVPVQAEAPRPEFGRHRHLGRLTDEFFEPLPEFASHNFRALAITFADGDRAGALPGDPRDPFDRMLAAQALNHGLALVSNDASLDAFGIVRIW